MEQELYQHAAYIVCEDSTGRENKGDDDFATEAHTVIDIVYEDGLDEDKF